MDASGLSIFDTDLKFHTKCKSNTVHQKMLMTELEKLAKLNTPNQSTSASKILHQIAENIHKRSLVVIFSDMLDKVSETDEIFDALQHLKYNKHEVILFHVQDKKYEVDFEFENRPYEFIDLESGETLKMNSTQLKDAYTQQMTEYRKQ